MPESAWTQFKTAVTTHSQTEGPLKSDLNTDFVDMWIGMLWKLVKTA